MDATIHMLCGVVCVARTMVDAVPLSVPMRSTDDVPFPLYRCTALQTGWWTRDRTRYHIDDLEYIPLVVVRTGTIPMYRVMNRVIREDTRTDAPKYLYS